MNAPVRVLALLLISGVLLPVRPASAGFVSFDAGPLGRTAALGVGGTQSAAPELAPLSECATDLFDVRQGITITAASATHPAFDVHDMFGTSFSSIEPGATIFADGQGAGFIHFVEWSTAAPVTLRSINLQASSIGSPGAREIDRFVLKAKSPGSPTFDLTLADFTPSHPYPIDSANPPYSLLATSVPETSAQAFRAELVDSGLGGGATGPRVMELDGFAAAVPECPLATPTPVATATSTASACNPAPTPTPGDPTSLGAAAKIAVACQKAIVKAAPSLLQKELTLTAKCARTILKCVQANDSSCAVSAGAACTAGLAKIDGYQAKLAATVRKKCGGSLTFGDLASGSGLGYAALAPECSAVDLATLSACLTTRLRCVGAELLDLEAARARELMSSAGVAPGTLQSISCLPDHGGTGAGLDDPAGAGKAVAKCAATMQKAGATFAKARLGNLGTCIGALFACRQLKPTDGTCLTKASGKCDKAFAKMASAAAKLAPTVDKACDETVIGFATLRAGAAANLAALAAECAAHGVASLDTLAEYETCLTRHHECRVADLLRFAVPRAGELLQAIGHELRSGFCPPPAGVCAP